MSDINGSGYGDAHDWRYVLTTAGRSSKYVCRRCGEIFYHHYPSVPDIFKAMKEYRGDPSGRVGVLEKCNPAIDTARERKE